MNTFQRLAVAGVASAAWLWASGVPADEAAPAPDDALGAVVSEESLAAARGGTEIQMSENNLEAVLEGNVASNLATGNNTLTEGAFSSNSGIPMVIQNTGNNVIIQNSTILNLGLN